MPGSRTTRDGGEVTQLVPTGATARYPGGWSWCRSRGTLELGLVGLLYLTYSLSRLLADDSLRPAAARGLQLHQAERALGMAWERPLNQWFVESRLAGLLGSFWYAAAHYLVTAVVLVWLYRRGAADYSQARRTLVLATVLALCAYLLMPVAPPRLTGGFADVLELHAAQGWWGSDASAPRGFGGLTNQVAAMPSLHAGWALWVALILHRRMRPPWRQLGWAHAAVTALVVVGTGNHWTFDVLAGWAVVLVGETVVRLTSTGGRNRELRTGGPSTVAASHVDSEGGGMTTPTGPTGPTWPPERTPPDPSTFVARSPTDLIAVVPGVLGFHPQDSVVLLTFGPPGGAFHARVDLPVERHEQEAVADALADAVHNNRVRRAAVVLYTDDVEAASSVSELLVERLLDLAVDVITVLRVDDGRWHLVPEDGSAGTAYELETHPFTAQRVFEGQVVHRDREELADSLVGTDDEDAVEVALAATRYADLVAGCEEATGSAPGFLQTEARWLQRCLRAHLADLRRLVPQEAARVLVLVSQVSTRDVAWAEISRETSGAHVDLWRDLVRRSPHTLLPDASALLAFAAWQHGDGALAWCAIDRCVEVDPDHSLAHYVADVLTRAVPPSTWEPIREDELSVFAPEIPPGSGRREDRAS